MHKEKLCFQRDSNPRLHGMRILMQQPRPRGHLTEIFKCAVFFFLTVSSNLLLTTMNLMKILKN